MGVVRVIHEAKVAKGGMVKRILRKVLKERLVMRKCREPAKVGLAA